MTRATRTLSIVGASLIFGGIGLHLAGSTDGSDRPVRGSLAALDTSRVVAWTELARLTPEELGGGRIRALDLVGDSLLVLQPNEWRLVVGGMLLGSYGTAVTGAPEYLARAEGIALTASGVAVLDAPRHRITMWSREGERLSDRLLPQTSRDVALHHSLTLSGTGLLLSSWVSSDTGGRWVLQRFSDTSVDTVPLTPAQRTGESFNVPHIVPQPDSGVIVVHAGTWQIRRYSRALQLIDSSQRINEPHFAPSAAFARRMRGHIAMLPETQRRDFLLGESLPSVRAATMTSEGELLVLTVRDDEATVAELVAKDGRAIAALWSRPDSSTMFAVRGSILRVRDLDSATVIERLELRPND